MYILGINEFWHDCSAVLLEGSRLLLAVEEERLSRKKHHPGFAFAGSGPERAIQWCLTEAGLSDGDIHAVGISINMTPERMLASVGKAFINALRRVPLDVLFRPGQKHNLSTSPLNHLLGATKVYFWDRRRFINSLRERFGRVYFIDHHYAHCISAYWLSGFDEANVIVIDGFGERFATSLYYAKDDRIYPLGRRYFHSQSLGLLYQTITYLLGFGPFDAGKTMGLSAWGNSRRCLARYLIPQKEGYSVRLSELRKLWHLRRDNGLLDVHRDIATSLQRKLEESALALVRFLVDRTGSRKLCLAGGVTLNCQMNAVLRESGLIDDIFIQPAAMDMGSAIGAGLEIARRYHYPRPQPLTHLFYGPRPDDAEIERVISESGSEVVGHALDSAQLISRGEIIGWFHGRAELGPRALGNRSILASPSSIEIRDEVNRRKGREWWRPLAPSVLEEKADEWFINACPSPFMVLNFRVKTEKRNYIRGIVHTDGTARVQTVRRETNPLFYDLIARYEYITGVPMLLNTSFNIRGEPIVNTPSEAIETARHMKLRYLVLGTRLLRLT